MNKGTLVVIVVVLCCVVSVVSMIIAIIAASAFAFVCRVVAVFTLSLLLL